VATTRAAPSAVKRSRRELPRDSKRAPQMPPQCHAKRLDVAAAIDDLAGYHRRGAGYRYQMNLRRWQGAKTGIDDELRAAGRDCAVRRGGRRLPHREQVRTAWIQRASIVPLPATRREMLCGFPL
jgi:hypothetical protein